MMLGERTHHLSPTIEVPSWPPTSVYHDVSLTSFRRFLPSNDVFSIFSSDTSNSDFACDEFRMYEFKVRRCMKGRSHDWTECPYAHPGEKARRRDPRKYHYSGTACPDYRKGSCKRGDSCDFAHGVFECWLHPARYRTQPCKDGIGCRRRVCFFAHTAEQLRVLIQSPKGSSSKTDSYDGSPMRQQKLQHHISSTPSSPAADSGGYSSSSMNELLFSMRQLQMSKASTVWDSPSSGSGGLFDGWLEPVERVESGRDLRAMTAKKVSMESCLGSGMDDISGCLS